jgi:uncharacterized protein (TIGR03437 family)
MDATQLLSKRSAFLLVFALILAGSWQAQGQTLKVPSSITVPGYGSGQSASLSATSSDGTTAIPFTYAVTYASGSNHWLLLNNSCSNTGSGTTPASLTLFVGCTYSQAGTNGPATITFTANNTTYTTTATLGSAAQTITATGAPGGSNSLTLQAAPGLSTSGTVTLSTTGATAINYTLATMNGGTWLSLPVTAGTVPGGGSTTFQVNASAAGLTSTPGPGTVVVSYLSNGQTQTVNVLVTFTVGSTSTGTIQLSQNPVNWSENTSAPTVLSSAVTVSVNSGSPSYSASINSNITPSNNYWLLLTSNSQTSPATFVTGTAGTALTLQSTSNIFSLPTGAYQAQINIQDSYGNSTILYVNLSVNGGSSGISISPNPVALSASYGSTTLVSAPVTVTSSTAGTLTASVTGTGLTGVGGSGVAVAAGGSVGLTVYGSASGLAQNTYTGTLTVTVTPTGGSSISQNFTVNFQVGTGTSTGTTGSAVAPATLQFNYETGQLAPMAQPIMIGGTSTFTITPTVNTPSGGNWLAVSYASGTAPAQVYVTVQNLSSLVSSTYQGTLSVSFGDGTTQQVTVYLTVTSATPLLYTNPGTVIFQQPSTTSPYQSIVLYATDNSTIPVTVTTSTSWLTLLNAPTSTQTSFAVQANTTNLPNGISTGSITVTYAGGTLTIPVVAYLTNGSSSSGGSCSGALTLGTCAISLTAAAGSSATVSSGSQLTVNATTPTYFTLAVTYTNTSTCTQQNWLSLNTYSGVTYTIITATANPSGLPVGTCNATITFTIPATGQTQSVGLTLTVTGSNVALSQTTWNPTATAAGTPVTQQVTVSSATAGTTVSFTASASVSTPSGGTWLTVSPTSGTTAAGTLTLTANPTNLTAGNYTGTVTVTPTGGGTAQTVTVNFTVTSAAISVSTTTLNFTYQAGGSMPAPQVFTVSGGTFTATASPANSWLVVNPTSGTAGTSVQVSINTSSLPTAGNYTGTITVAGTNGTTGTQTVNVSVSVTAPLPTITAVVNAASFAPGTAISPGEVISIGGSGLGPATPVTLTLDSNGRVSTSIGGVTVTIGGYPAPLIYASSTLISAVVPYEVAGQISPSIVVKFLGQTSNGYPLTAVVAQPGIFTQSSQGTGPGAILNQDYSLNGAAHPAAKGSTVQVFMTGEGKPTPTPVDGTVTCVAGCSSISQIPVPLLSVSALVNGQPAQVTFAGSAPGLVSGVLQVNVVIPATASSGAVPIVISVGTAASQSGVTVQVQ